MKFSVFALLLIWFPRAHAQQSAAPPAPVSPDAVVAEVDGKKYTSAAIDKIVASLPPQIQVSFRRDPKQALSYILMMRFLAAEAEKAKLDQDSPLKETIEYTRVSALAQAEINQVRNVVVNVQQEDEMKYYKAHLDHYQEAKVKVLYVAFSAAKPADGAKKILTEEEAKAKIEGLRKQIAEGAGFGTLARENSDDKESAAKDGDFGTIKRSSSYPDAIKNAVFALKPGQVSEPVRQPNGFYLLRLESLATQTYDQVRTQIYDLLKQQGFDEWMRGVQKRYEVKVEDPAYFTKPAPTAPAPAK